MYILISNASWLNLSIGNSVSSQVQFFIISCNNAGDAIFAIKWWYFWDYCEKYEIPESNLLIKYMLYAFTEHVHFLKNYRNSHAFMWNWHFVGFTKEWYISYHIGIFFISIGTISSVPIYAFGIKEGNNKIAKISRPLDHWQI